MPDVTEFACPHCNYLYRMSPAQMEKYGGKTLRCKSCQQKFQAPAAEPSHSGGDQPIEAAEQQAASEAPSVEDHGDPAAQPNAEYAADAGPEYAPQTPYPAQPYSTQPGMMAYQPASPGGSDFYQFLTFRKNITPFAIQILFWVGVAMCVLAGLGMMLTGLSMSRNPTNAFLSFLFGIVYLLAGPVLVRIYCELIIIIFRIYETLQDIQQTLRNKP